MGLPFFTIIYRSFVDRLPLLDFWWHLKMGQLIVQKSAIPRIDDFSFTAIGKLYVLQNWLAEIIMYGIYKCGGPPLALFANGIIMACVLIPIYWLCRKSSDRLVAAVFPVTLVAFCIPGSIRPQVFSYLLFAFCYWMVSSYCADGKQSRIWYLPFLFVLWVNIHGAFVLGLGLIAIILGCEAIRFLLDDGWPLLPPRRLRPLGIILVLSLAGTLVNPEGYKIYAHVLTVVNSSSVRQFVTEWQPPVVNQITGIVMFFGPFFLLTFLLITSKKRPSLTEFVLFGAFAVFGMMAIRNAAWFLIIAAPLIAKYLPRSDDWRSLFRKERNLESGIRVRKESLPLNRIILLGSLIALIIQCPWLHTEGLLDPGTPVKAMDFMDRNQLKGNMYHSQVFGDYLIWRLWPMQRSFFDGRVHLFDESIVRFYLQVMSDSHWEEMLEKYKVKYLLLPKGKSGSEEMKMVGKAYKSKYWKCRYEDSVSALFERVYPDRVEGMPACR